METVPDQSTLTRRYTEEAIQFIRQNRPRPFLLYLAHTFPHVPLFASPSFRGRSPRGLYGDVVEELDASVGQIIEALRSERLEKNTLVLFTSDNGPWLTQKLAGGSAGLLRDGKGSTCEGGLRVPCIAWWPGKIKPGAVTRELACQLDLFPTCLALAGGALPRDRALDGFDLAPVLFESRPSPRQVFFYYRGTQLYAARKGPYKAHFITRAAYGKDEPQRHDPPLLFHLGHDPSEQFSMATNHLEVLADIAREVERHRANLTVAKSQLDE
jgi:arylsulfatase A-like enzyme